MAAAILLKNLNLPKSVYQRIATYPFFEQISKPWIAQIRACSYNKSPNETSTNSPPPQQTDTLFHQEQKTFSVQQIQQLLQEMENDGISKMPDPYKAAVKKCIFCKYNIEIDYKNVRLLSQFVSPYTGRIYGRKTTKLCIPMQKHIAKLIKRARVLAFMPYMHKDVSYLSDPNLFKDGIKDS